MSYKYDLGSHHRTITTDYAEAQQWFDRGLIWIYAFDLEMAGRCFREAITVDDNCAMAYWGLAYSSGIYYNKPWHRMQKDELAQKLNLTYETSRAALERSGHVTPVESMLIEPMTIHKVGKARALLEQKYRRLPNDKEIADELEITEAEAVACKTF